MLKQWCTDLVVTCWLMVIIIMMVVVIEHMYFCQAQPYIRMAFLLAHSAQRGSHEGAITVVECALNIATTLIDYRLGFRQGSIHSSLISRPS